MAFLMVGGVFKEFDDSYITRIGEQDQSQTKPSENILQPALAAIYESTLNASLTIPAGDPIEREEWLDFFNTIRIANRIAISTKNVLDSRSIVFFTSMPILALQQSLCALFTKDFQMFIGTNTGLSVDSTTNDSEITSNVSFSKIDLTAITSRLAPIETVTPSADPRLDFSEPTNVVPNP